MRVVKPGRGNSLTIVIILSLLWPARLPDPEGSYAATCNEPRLPLAYRDKGIQNCSRKRADMTSLQLWHHSKPDS